MQSLCVCCSVLQCVAVYCSVLQCIYRVVVLSRVFEAITVWHDSLICETSIRVCVRSVLAVRHDSWLIHMWDIPMCLALYPLQHTAPHCNTLQRSTHFLFPGYFHAHCVTWLIRACDMTHFYASLGSSKCVTWQTFICVFGVALVAPRLFVLQCVAACCSVL